MTTVATIRKEEQRCVIGGIICTPHKDGTFTMLLENDNTHVPRHLALEHYPSLMNIHDRIFGVNNWGLAIPLTFNDAPIGETATMAFTLRRRTFAALMNFLVVLTQIEVVAKGQVPPGETEAQALLERRAGVDTVKAMLEGMEDQRYALSWACADKIAEVRKVLKDTAETDELRELYSKVSLPL
jgi:hypothetical protein